MEPTRSYFAILILVVAMVPAQGMAQIIMLRLAVALLGYMAVSTGSRGDFPHALSNAVRDIRDNRDQAVSWSILVVIVASIIVFVGVPYFHQVQRYKLTAYVRSSLEINGTAILSYTQDYDERLPSNITQQTIGSYLKPYQPKLLLVDPISKKPFIWRHSLSGISVKKIKHPEKVIVAYSVSYYDREYVGESRTILFLSGNSFLLSDEQFWELMREQRKLLQEK